MGLPWSLLQSRSSGSISKVLVPLPAGDFHVRATATRIQVIRVTRCLGFVRAEIRDVEQGADLWAHLFGWLAGLALGLPIASALARPPGAALQLTLGAATLLALAACWSSALY